MSNQNNKNELLSMLSEMKIQITEFGYIYPKSSLLGNFLKLNEKGYKLMLKSMKEGDSNGSS